MHVTAGVRCTRVTKSGRPRCIETSVCALAMAFRVYRDFFSGAKESAETAPQARPGHDSVEGSESRRVHSAGVAGECL